MKNRKEIMIIVFILFLLLVINYNLLDKKLESFLIPGEYALVERVIDGDTIEINKTSVRLLGINTPERGEDYYKEAKEFLENKIFNETVRLEFGKDKNDRYGRLLAYIFFNGENINLEIVERGLGNYYFPSGKDHHYDDFKDAWSKCIEEKKNLCEKSSDTCSQCVNLREFDPNNQKIILENVCSFSCDLNDWAIKDEGRKKFVFDNFVLKPRSEVKVMIGNKTSTLNELFWSNEDYVWTNTGDTLFLRDSSGKLVLWESY